MGLLNTAWIPSGVSGTRQATNPFTHLPEDKLDIIREYFLKSEFAGRVDFGEYLAWLHQDDLIPEEVLDIIASRNSADKKAYSSVEELLADLKSG